MWELRKSLGTYHYSEEKRRLLYAQEEDQAEEPAPLAEEEHGDKVEDDVIEDAIQGVQQEQQQKAAEYNKNRDAEGSRIVGTPSTVEKKESEESSPDSSGHTSSGDSPSVLENANKQGEGIQESPSTHTPVPDWLSSPKSSSLDINDEAWGCDELEYVSVKADYMS